MLDPEKDLKTRERWTQIHNSTSQILNTVLKDLQMKDWENRLRVIEEYRKQGKRNHDQESPNSATTVP
jgi:hypothetical protein